MSAPVPEPVGQLLSVTSRKCWITGWVLQTPWPLRTTRWVLQTPWHLWTTRWVLQTPWHLLCRLAATALTQPTVVSVNDATVYWVMSQEGKWRQQSKNLTHHENHERVKTWPIRNMMKGELKLDLSGKWWELKLDLSGKWWKESKDDLIQLNKQM